MIASILALSLVVARDVAPDGWRLARAIEQASAAARLPSQPMAATTRGLWLRLVKDSSAPPARLVRHRFPGQPTLPAHGAPSWFRLELAAGHYAGTFVGGTFVGDPPPVRDLADLPADSVAWLYGALLGHILENDIDPGAATAWKPAATARGHATLIDVPVDQRLDVFAEAGASFLGHALSVAHEIGRHERRRRDRGASLCGAMGVRASLFGLWQHSVFDGERYTGFYRRRSPPGDEHGGSPWVESEHSLSVEDRRWWAKTVLGVAWTGDPAKDFAWVCAPP